MKKVAVLVFAILTLVGCANQDVELLQESLRSSIELNERNISEKNTELKYAAAENPRKALPWFEKSRQLQVFFDEFKAEMVLADEKSREELLACYEKALLKMDSVYVVENEEGIAEPDFKDASGNVLALCLTSELIKHQYYLVNDLLNNVALNFECWFGVHTRFLEEQDGWSSVEIFGDTRGVLPERIILLDSVTYNEKDTLLEFDEYKSVIGGIAFRDLQKGNYSLKGRVVYRKNSMEIDEVPFHSEFEVK